MRESIGHRPLRGHCPCFPSNFKHNLLREGTGTTDHLTPLWTITHHASPITYPAYNPISTHRHLIHFSWRSICQAFYIARPPSSAVFLLIIASSKASCISPETQKCIKLYIASHSSKWCFTATVHAQGWRVVQFCVLCVIERLFGVLVLIKVIFVCD